MAEESLESDLDKLSLDPISQSTINPPTQKRTTEHEKWRPSGRHVASHTYSHHHQPPAAEYTSHIPSPQDYMPPQYSPVMSPSGQMLVMTHDGLLVPAGSWADYYGYPGTFVPHSRPRLHSPHKSKAIPIKHPAVG